MGTGSFNQAAKNAAIPADLAEWLGAVRLTHFALEAVQGVDAPLTEFRLAPDRPGHGFRMLLTLLTYAYARGAAGSEEIQERCRTDLDFRYLSTAEFPDTATLRRFRQREWARLQVSLAGLLRLAVSGPGEETDFDAELEAARRLEAAAAADSLALDC
ncbi:MAG: transposase [Verrucomicrobia bacterium]|nr:transposase [Verrucomicrobiota bacterium]